MQPLYKFKIFENVKLDSEGNPLAYGDAVIITDKNSIYYRQTGKISEIFPDGECQIRMDYSKIYITKYELFDKIEYVVDSDSGEVLIMPYSTILYLIEMEYIKKLQGVYYFDDEVRWKIERFGY